MVPLKVVWNCQGRYFIWYWLWNISKFSIWQPCKYKSFEVSSGNSLIIYFNDRVFKYEVFCFLFSLLFFDLISEISKWPTHDVFRMHEIFTKFRLFYTWHHIRKVSIRTFSLKIEYLSKKRWSINLTVRCLHARKQVQRLLSILRPGKKQRRPSFSYSSYKSLFSFSHNFLASRNFWNFCGWFTFVFA